MRVMKPFKITLALSALAILCACHKTKTPEITETPTETTEMKSGLPDNNFDVHGYMYAGFTRFNTNMSGDYGTLNCYCAMRDPSGDLLSTYNHYSGSTSFAFGPNAGNIDVGVASFNNMQLFKNNTGQSLFYQTNGSGNVSFAGLQSNWKTNGNGVFKPVDLTVPRGFPKVTTFPDNATYNITVSQGFTFAITGNYSNYDSIACTIGYFNSFTAAHKAVAAGASSIVFSPSDLANISMYSNLPVYIALFNYSNKTIENKKYVFELSTQCSANANISQ